MVENGSQLPSRPRGRGEDRPETRVDSAESTSPPDKVADSAGRSKSSETKDFWPDDLFAGPEPKTAIAILREQAALLAEKTEHVLEGRVESKPHTDVATLRRSRLAKELGSSQFLNVKFVILAPALGNYRYLLLWLAHPMTLYPVVLGGSAFEGNECRADDEAALIRALRTAFASDHTRTVVAGLLAQSRSMA